MASPTPSIETLTDETMQNPRSNIGDSASCNNLEQSESMHLFPLLSSNSRKEDESSDLCTKFNELPPVKSKVRHELTASLGDLSKVKERVLKSVIDDLPDNPLLDTISITSSRSLFVNTGTRMKSDFGTRAGSSDRAGDRAGTSDRANYKFGADDSAGTSDKAGTSGKAGTSEQPGSNDRAESTDETEPNAYNGPKYQFPVDTYRTNQLWDFYQVDFREFKLSSFEMTLDKQQKALLSDLIYTLSGVRGFFITPLPRNNIAKDISAYETKFRVHECIDKSLAHIAHEILPLASHFVGIQKLMAITGGRGQVNNALNAALMDLSHDFYLLLAQAEAELEQDRLTLPKLLYYMQPTIWIMRDIWASLSKILLCDLKGAALLSHLCESLNNMAGNKSTQDSMMDLTNKAAQPYMNMLQLWTQKGVIVDKFKEFMIMDNESKHMGQLADHYFDIYWEKRYTIRSECIPSFLKNYSDMILRTGKYLNVIRQCGKRGMPTKLIDLRYNPRDEQEHVKVINDAYVFSARMLLDVLLSDNDMMGHLQSVKRYFLLHQGDFIMEFMDACEDELTKNVDHVQPMTLENLLGLSLRLTSARNDKYKDNLHCELLTYDLVTQMSKIMKPSDGWKTSDRLDLNGLECFAFTYEAKWPVSLVLNHTSISKYQMLFRQLFYCKHVERQLCNIWKENSMAKKLPSNVSELYRSAFTLRQRMMNAIQNLEYYMMTEIIEPYWHLFVVNLKKVENIDKLLSLHQDFLDVCLKNCMLTEQSHLNRAIFKLCKICLKFCEFIQQSESFFLKPELKTMVRDQSDSEIAAPDQKQSKDSMDQSDTFAKRVKNFDAEFTTMLISFLKQLNDLAQANTGDRFIYLVRRINFNGYYSEQMEKLHDIKYK
ncbi:gamma-tubulin complex component 2 homolog [Drosophila innubila]|uniref:gamma-tubulin complex component 2 homolog n=1 Tax=Drosophila innubila TaxID=198719 RepID=UPI00148D17F6|nr:gamma-tubulin complex component 2 homolog [Drosophila innubila]